MSNFEEIAKLLGEGFFADKIVGLKDKLEEPELQRVKDYIHAVKRSRGLLNSDKLGTLDDLHKLTRFYEWFSLRYGQQKVRNKQEANSVFITVLHNLYLKLETRLDFFGWLQKKTLDEVSDLMPQG